MEPSANQTGMVGFVRCTLAVKFPRRASRTKQRIKGYRDFSVARARSEYLENVVKPNGKGSIQRIRT